MWPWMDGRDPDQAALTGLPVGFTPGPVGLKRALEFPMLNFLCSTPFLQISQHKWSRSLVQYRETYSHSNYAASALLQWCARPGTVLALQAVKGRTQSAAVCVVSFDFIAHQPGGDYSQ